MGQLTSNENIADKASVIYRMTSIVTTICSSFGTASHSPPPGSNIPSSVVFSDGVDFVVVSEFDDDETVFWPGTETNKQRTEPETVLEKTAL